MKVYGFLTAFLLSGVSSTAADYTVKLDASTVVTSWEGWGTSLAWWANVFGDRVDIADLLFTNASTVSITNGAANLPGLSLNVARYNIGGTSNNLIDNQYRIKASPQMPPFKAIDSFWLDWFSTDPSSSSWNWKADAKQRAMLVAAHARNVNVLEAFSNSPPWWMNNNHATAGSDKKNGDNLQPWNHEKFAIYLSTVVQQAKAKWGIPFQYVEPFNEPSADWWTFPSAQEGCHFSIVVQKNVLKLLRKHLDQRQLKDVAITASDENSVDDSINTLQSMTDDSAATQAIVKVNTHGYSGLDPYRGPNRDKLKSLTQKLGKKLWDSEYGENDGSGLKLAESIGLDINVLGVSAFVYWQALDSGGWGLVQSNPGDKWIGNPNPKYFVMAQYSRHIRPGMSILASPDPKTVMAYDATSKVLVIVSVNMDTKVQSITYDLSKFVSVSSSVKSWVTETKEIGFKYQPVTDVEVNSKKRVVVAPLVPQSVRTIEIQGVEFSG